MRAISLWQPWASLWASGRKVHETRHWSTGYRGPLAIHAAKRVEPIGSIDPELLAVLGSEFGSRWRMEIPYGAIVGVCRVMSCTLIHDRVQAEHIAAHADDIAAGNWEPGRYAWEGAEFHRFMNPIPWTGRQGFFSVPDSLLQKAA